MEIKKLNKFNKGSLFILIPKTLSKDFDLKVGDCFIFIKGENKNIIILERVVSNVN